MTQDAHVTLDELAEYDDRLLPDMRQLEITAHLDSCADCRDSLSRLALAREQLHAVSPLPMPDDVAARLQDALRSAASDTDASPTADSPESVSDGSSSSGSATVIPHGIRRRRRIGMPTFAASAASFIVVAAIAAVIVGHHHHRSMSSGGTDAAGSAGASSPFVHSGPLSDITVRSTGTLYTASNLGTLAAQLVSGQPSPASGAPVTLPPSSSGTTGSAGGTSKSAASAPVPKGLRTLANSRTALVDCASGLATTPNAVPIAVDFGRWKPATGHSVPAAVFVFRQSVTTGIAIVVPAGCPAGVLLSSHSVALS